MLAREMARIIRPFVMDFYANLSHVYSEYNIIHPFNDKHMISMKNEK
jgi:fido (protein-threonine AMPylation protein)